MIILPILAVVVILVAISLISNPVTAQHVKQDKRRVTWGERTERSEYLPAPEIRVGGLNVTVEGYETVELWPPEELHR